MPNSIVKKNQSNSMLNCEYLFLNDFPYIIPFKKTDPKLRRRLFSYLKKGFTECSRIIHRIILVRGSWNKPGWKTQFNLPFIIWERAILYLHLYVKHMLMIETSCMNTSWSRNVDRTDLQYCRHPVLLILSLQDIRISYIILALCKHILEELFIVSMPTTFFVVSKRCNCQRTPYVP